MDVPEIDGVIYIPVVKPLKIGQFVSCQITEVKDYDLIAKCIY